jgi:hypothetical protein
MVLGDKKVQRLFFLTTAIKKKNEACIEAWIERSMIKYVSSSIPVD